MQNSASLAELDVEPVRQRANEMLHADLVAPDDHVVMLTVTDPVAATRQHGEVLVASTSNSWRPSGMANSITPGTPGHSTSSPKSGLCSGCQMIRILWVGWCRSV